MNSKNIDLIVVRFLLRKSMYSSKVLRRPGLWFEVTQLSSIHIQLEDAAASKVFCLLLCRQDIRHPLTMLGQRKDNLGSSTTFEPVLSMIWGSQHDFWTSFEPDLRIPAHIDHLNRWKFPRCLQIPYFDRSLKGVVFRTLQYFFWESQEYLIN